MRDIIKEIPFPWLDETWNRYCRPKDVDAQFNNLFSDNDNKISKLFGKIRDFIASVLTKGKTPKDPQKK